AQYADEPEKRDSSERHETKREQNRVSPRVVREPAARIAGIRRDGRADENEGHREEGGEGDTGKRRRTRCPDRPSHDPRLVRTPGGGCPHSFRSARRSCPRYWPARTMQRKPRCVVDESIACPCRPAGL